ncbi:unnamed protein product [Closterium sp. NIES-64]|nr:unnamed protein product [Closterium sp. NIES-64]
MHVDPNTSLAAQRVLAAHKAKHLHVEVDSPSGVPSHGGNSGGAIVTGEGPEFREPAQQQQQQQLPPIQAQAQAVPGEGATVPQPLLSKSGRPVVRGMGPVQPQQARQPSPQLMQLQQQQQQQHAALQGYGQGAQGLVQQMGGLSMGESFSQQPYAMAPQMPQGIGPQGGMQQGMGQQGMGQQGIGQQGMGQQGMGQQGMGQVYQQQAHAPGHMQAHPQQQQAASGFAASPLSQNHSPSMPMYHQNSGPPQQQQPLHPYQQQSPMQGRSHMGKVAYGHQAPRPPLSGGSIGGHLESEEGLPRQGSGKRFPKQPPQPPMDPQAATRRYLTGPGKSLAASIGFRSGSLNEHQMQQQQQHGGAGMGAPADLPFRRTATEYSGPPGRADAMTVAPRSSTLGGEGQYRRKVYMNGQPVPDKLVFLAERRIGTIEPGSYWYDCRAGFWGPVGGPAFGVTPAFMREFGMQPMQSDCSGGKTKVFVNGRELHKKDLVTLMKRGFPDTPGARYTLDADGTVCNEAGRHLFAMGKLMVDKKKGMYMVKPQ